MSAVRPALRLGPATQCCALRTLPIRCFVTSRPSLDQGQPPANEEPLDVESLFSKPTWSVSSLLPPKNSDPSTAEEVTPKQLHHLLRLSALPRPASPEQEGKMLATLRDQLHFVRSIQSVDTTGVTPLRSLRDETAEGEREAELGLDEIREVLEGEEVRGKWHRRIRRRRNARVEGQGADAGWDVLGQAERKTGRYFVVEGGKKDG